MTVKSESVWRLIDTGLERASSALAKDEAIMEAIARGLVPNTLRFMGFEPPAALVGYHQSIDAEVRIDVCRELGFDCNRRATGGGAILMTKDQIGMALIVSEGWADFLSDVELSFMRLSRGIVEGLRSLGIEAEFRPKNDIEVRGQKIAGTGQFSDRGVRLFHASILYDVDIPLMLKVLKVCPEKLVDKVAKSVKERLTSIVEETGGSFSMEEVKRALVKGYEEALEIKLLSGQLTEFEQSLAEEIAKRYESGEWIFARREPEGFGSHVRKTPGGLLRVYAAVDRGAIKSVLITGDFFAFPPRAIFDLEAALKWTPAEKGAIQEVVRRFLAEKPLKIVGVSVEDLTSAISEAARSASSRSDGG